MFLDYFTNICPQYTNICIKLYDTCVKYMYCVTSSQCVPSFSQQVDQWISYIGFKR